MNWLQYLQQWATGGFLKYSKEEIRQDLDPPVYSNLVKLKVIAN